MLAVDAATEMRSLTLLYERWADRLYRYFLLSTADPATADRMMQELLIQLPDDLQRFASSEKSFGGWLLGKASEVFWREFSVPSRMYRRVSRYLPSRKTSDEPEDSASLHQSQAPEVGGFDEIAPALARLTPDRREVLGIQFGASLKTASAAEALRLPASLMSSHVQWGLQALADELEATNNRRFQEDFERVAGGQVLTSAQRQKHFTIIHGLFTGDVSVQSSEPERAPIFEIGALVGVVLLGLLGIWIWSLITSGDPQDRELAATIETVADDDSEPTPTAEPEPTPTIEPEPTEEPETMLADEADGGTCFAADGKAHFDRFVGRFNDGHMDRLSEMLPEAGAADGSMNQPMDDDSDVFIHGGELVDQADLADFFAERYEAGERWDVLDAYPAEHYRNWNQAAPLEMYQDWKRDNPHLSMIIVAGMDVSGEGDDRQLLQGRVTVDCDEETVIGWDLQPHGGQNSHSVSVDEFLSLSDSLEPNQTRRVSAIVQAEDRVDGGALSAWEIVWIEARDEDDRELQRIEINTLDGAPQIVYIQNGSRWSLNQRGWMIYGGEGESPPFSDEVSLPTSWLPEIAAMLEEEEQNANLSGSRQISRDYSFTSSGGSERFLRIDIADGAVDTVQVREYSANGSRVRPELWVSEVLWSENLDPVQFEVAAEPDYPALVVDAPRFEVPIWDAPELAYHGVIPGFDQTEESYQISWNDVRMDLTVRPSRGGLDVRSIPPTLDESWTTAAAEYDWGTLVWAHRQFAGYPTEGLWDDGRYLFELVVDREQMSPDDDWNLRELVKLANVLGPVELQDLEQETP